jgi:hypothetical protein
MTLETLAPLRDDPVSSGCPPWAAGPPAHAVIVPPNLHRAGDRIRRLSRGLQDVVARPFRGEYLVAIPVDD